MKKHTKEPWNRGDWKTNAIGTKEASAVITDDGEIDFLIQHENPDTEAALCERVATCINALAGIEDPAAALKRERDALSILRQMAEYWKHGSPIARGSILALEALALLKGEA